MAAQQQLLAAPSRLKQIYGDGLGEFKPFVMVQ